MNNEQLEIIAKLRDEIWDITDAEAHGGMIGSPEEVILQATAIIAKYKSSLLEPPVMQKIADDIGGWKEDMKAVIADAIDRQETQMNEDYERGREEATKYALEMFDKHVSNFSA